MTLFQTFYIIHGILFFISILFIFEKIGRNDFVGIRIGKALWNEKNWYKVHKFGGWSMLITSIVTILYMFLLQMSKKYFFPELNINVLCAIGAIISTLVGDAVIPITYSFIMSDSDNKTEEKKNIMDSFMTSYAVTIYVLLCIILIMFVAPLAFNKVGPNNNYGFRISKTLSSEEIWYKANQFSGWATIISSCISLVCILFMKLFFSKTTSWYNNGLVYLMVFLIPQAISFLVSFLYILKL